MHEQGDGRMLNPDARARPAARVRQRERARKKDGGRVPA
jgi:hypothetical protein